MPAPDLRWQDASIGSTGLFESEGSSGFLAGHSFEKSQQQPGLSLEGAAGSFTERGVKRKPLLLLQLQRTAPPGLTGLGGATSRQDRSYDVMVEPGGNPPLAWLKRVRETSTKAWVEPGGLVPWIPTLRGAPPPKQRPKQEAAQKPTWKTGRSNVTPMALPGLSPSSLIKDSPALNRDWAKSPGSISGVSTRPGTCAGSTRPGTSAENTRPNTSAGDSGARKSVQQSLTEDFILTTHPGALVNQEDRQELGPSKIQNDRQEEQHRHSGEQPRSENLTVGEHPIPKVDSSTKFSVSTSSSGSGGGGGGGGGGKRARGKHVTKEPEEFVMTNKGMKAQPSAMNMRIRNQIKDLGSNLLKNMTNTFSRDIWDACEVLHPDGELERARALAAMDELAEAEKLAQKVKGLDFGFGSKHDEKKEKQDKKGRAKIAKLEETEDTHRQMQEERALAWLARQTGWSVLDVEEVREVFTKYSVNGSMTVGGGEFVNMVQEISDCSPDDVKLLNQQIVGVRRRSIGWRHRSRFDQVQQHDRSEVRFSEFYLALVKWLAIQQNRGDIKEEPTKPRLKNRSSRGNFLIPDKEVTQDIAKLLGLKTAEETKKETTTTGRVNDLAEFRKLKKEIKEEILGGGPKDGLFERQRKQRQQAKAMGRKRGFLKRDDSGSDVSELSKQSDKNVFDEEEEEEEEGESDAEVDDFGNDLPTAGIADDNGEFGLFLDGI